VAEENCLNCVDAAFACGWCVTDSTCAISSLSCTDGNFQLTCSNVNAAIAGAAAGIVTIVVLSTVLPCCVCITIIIIIIVAVSRSNRSRTNRTVIVSSGQTSGQPVYVPSQGYVQNQPMMGQPMMGQPMNGQPMMGQPMMGQPMMGQPMNDQPMNTDSVPPPYEP